MRDNKRFLARGDDLVFCFYFLSFRAVEIVHLKIDCSCKVEEEQDSSAGRCFESAQGLERKTDWTFVTVRGQLVRLNPGPPGA